MNQDETLKSSIISVLYGTIEWDVCVDLGISFDEIIGLQLECYELRKSLRTLLKEHHNYISSDTSAEVYHAILDYALTTIDVDELRSRLASFKATFLPISIIIRKAAQIRIHICKLAANDCEISDSPSICIE
jgi:hypothetical protein